MKNIFTGFYTPSDETIRKSWSDSSTLFVFDTNVLLNLYRYTSSTRDDFFQIIDAIADKIWIPYHVGLEYQINRLSVIKTEKNIFNNLKKYIEDIEKNLDTVKLRELKLNQKLPILQNETEKLQSDINKLISDYKEKVLEWDNKQPCVRSTDNIRKKIDLSFAGKIGSIPKNQEWLNAVYEEGEIRYENKIPPGYMDKEAKEKKEDFFYSDLRYKPKYGDLIIWKQTLEKISESDIKSVIFVTDDVKDDWLYILDSNGKKEIGARAELREEIHKKTSITSFEILRTMDFMQNGKEFLSVFVKEDSIKETKTNFEDKQLKYYVKTNIETLNEFEKILAEQEKYSKYEQSKDDVFSKILAEQEKYSKYEQSKDDVFSKILAEQEKYSKYEQSKDDVWSKVLEQYRDVYKKDDVWSKVLKQYKDVYKKDD